jgi:hypothetical protein
MTSPRQRKKRAIFLKMEKKLEAAKEQHKPVVLEKQVEQKKPEPPKPVATPPQAVVESDVGQKPKKAKPGLVEIKAQEQVLEQPKEEVKTETKE